MIGNYETTKFNKDGDVILLFPDGTGNVYLASQTVPIHRWGHWKTCVEKIAKLGIEPIARLLRDESGRLNWTPLKGDDYTAEQYTSIVQKCEKLLGVDWKVPLNQQKQAVINKACVYIGVENTIEMAHELIQRAESFEQKAVIVKKALEFQPKKVEQLPETPKVENPMETFAIFSSAIDWTIWSNTQLKNLCKLHNIQPKNTKDENIELLCEQLGL